jgi:aldose 1-epimerase
MLRTIASLAGFFALVIGLAGFSPAGTQNGKPDTPARKINARLTMEPFGKTPDGREVDLYTLSNKNGLEVGIMNYGGVIRTLKAPDRNGKFKDIVLGFDNLGSYVAKNPYFGALVGRYANRIGNAKFTLDGKEYHVPKNDGPNCLHGGIINFSKQLWIANGGGTPQDAKLVLEYESADGEEGFPGKLAATVTYTLNDKNELRIDYAAVSDKPTVVNLTNHSYFNLAGQGSGDILNHVVTIYASKFTPVNATLIPTGELKAVAGTAFDFTKPTRIGERIGADDQQLKYGMGYDHNWVLDHPAGALSLAARAEDPGSGRVLEVLTDQPGVQFYTGNHLDGTDHGKGGSAYQQRYGFCLETQHFPDSPNKPSFPSTVLRPGGQYHSTTVLRFSAK